MPSEALLRWRGEARRHLDAFARAHRALGRRSAREVELNHAYAIALSARFQEFCRNLHDEAARFLSRSVGSPRASDVLGQALTEGRRIDTGNPNPGALAQDFRRFGLELWPKLDAIDRTAAVWRARLEKLNAWRNAVAHRSFARRPDLRLAGDRRILRLSDVRTWRTACDRLARSMDRAIGEWLRTLVGISPWT